MAAGQKTPGAMPPPLAPPPAQPVSGIARQYSQIAPQLTEKPTGADPVKELNERQAAAIAKLTGKAADSDQAEAREGAPPPPKAKTEQKPTSKPSEPSSTDRNNTSKKPTSDTATAKTSAGAEAESDDEETSGAGDAAGATRGPRYTVAALRKYAEEHPEEAAELRKVFNLPDDTREEWIRIKNRSRKVRGEITAEREKSLVVLRAEREATEAAAKAIDDAAGKLGPVVDLWDAVGERIRANPENPQPDFEAADAAFHQNTGITIDEYMRLRARRGVSNPEAVRLRAENAKLQRQIAGKPSEQVAAAVKVQPKAEAASGAAGDKESDSAPDNAPAAAKAPKKAKREAKDWSEELPERHKLRQIADWNVKLDNEMRKFHDPDLDEYDADPEEVAAKVLERELRLLAEPDPDDDDDEQPKAKKGKRSGTLADDGIPGAGKLKPKKPTAKVESEGDDEDKVKVGKMTMVQRQKWALDRHSARMRGELE